ncbi:1-acyl-sn-glycerol-3-phosphate acyltransferase [Agrobacterium sp. a22-2]|uniref:lysophospholipid acyltransferase family protein n=1 Tax=Agrobacterium sp. a22-2 TaxID=2283840 RepID=UPI00144851D2|nr:1-acyl-sn-glycerol-3-phosphate acyltransferase [Agrobacterium sp. a22-2]NKN35075.1 1-acyl-sn-glycerol-3-phosphate acyltransferase [Agrobacterium sp. a22-2]
MITWIRIVLVLSAIALMTVVLAPLQMVGLVFDLKLRRRLPRLWHRMACWLLGIRIHVHGELDRRRPLMIAANHASWKDILVLGSLADVVYIAKAEVAEWPVFGVLSKLQKTIYVVREQKRTTGDQVGEIARRMADGEIVVLFPEGTTSDGNRMLEVKSSLFGAAAAALPLAPAGIVYVQPVAIAYMRVQGMPMGRYHRPIAGWPGDVALLPHLLGVLKAGALDVDVTFGRSIEHTKASKRKEVSSRIEVMIRRMLLDRLRGRHKQ